MKVVVIKNVYRFNVEKHVQSFNSALKILQAVCVRKTLPKVIAQTEHAPEFNTAFEDNCTNFEKQPGWYFKSEFKRYSHVAYLTHPNVCREYFLALRNALQVYKGKKTKNIMWGVKEVKKIKIWTSFVISRRKAGPHILILSHKCWCTLQYPHVLFENWLIYPNWNENLN